MIEASNRQCSIPPVLHQLTTSLLTESLFYLPFVP